MTYRPSVFRNVFLWSWLLCLAAAAADAGSDRFILRVDLDGEGCPSELVVVEATGCDPEAMADDLVDELDAAGLLSANCISYGGENEYLCEYFVGKDCDIESTSITIESGDSCENTTIGITARDFGEAFGDFPGVHLFAIDRTSVFSVWEETN